MDDRFVDAVAAHFAIPPNERRGEAAMSQPLGFQRQKGQLLDGIRETQVTIEFDTVDHAERPADADVLRAQIAVPLDDMRSAGGHFRARKRDEPALRIGQLVGQRLTQLAAIRAQRAPVGGDLPSQATEIDLASNRRAACVAKESDQQGDQPIDLGVADRLPLEDVVEKTTRRQASHLDEPVNDLAIGPKAESAGRIG